MPEWYEPRISKCLVCGIKIEDARFCQKCKEKHLALLMWIGKTHYPTVTHFINEANQFGISKRIHRLPEDVVVGKTKVFLIHPTAFNGKPAVFGFFVIQKFELIVKDGTSLREELKRKGIQPISEGAALEEKERGCGKRPGGSLYITTYLSVQDLLNCIGEKWIDQTDIHGPLVLFKTPIPLEYTKKFRGYSLVDGDRILNWDPEPEWFLILEESRRKKQHREPKQYTVEVEIGKIEKAKPKIVEPLEVEVDPDHPLPKYEKTGIEYDEASIPEQEEEWFQLFQEQVDKHKDNFVKAVEEQAKVVEKKVCVFCKPYQMNPNLKDNFPEEYHEGYYCTCMTAIMRSETGGYTFTEPCVGLCEPAKAELGLMKPEPELCPLCNTEVEWNFDAKEYYCENCKFSF